MTLPRTIAAAATLLAVGAPMFTPEPSAAANAADRTSAVSWNACPEYTDEVLAWMGLPAEAVPDVAFTRLKATDQANRLGSLALNPGGPGGSGYLMPLDLSMAPPGVTPIGLELNERYDLIGFDPRGVGYSTSYDCPDAGPGGPPPTGEVTEEHARERYAAVVAANRACSQSNPAFLSQLTTVNVAHDLDRIRAALGEDRMNFLGVSWGTWLGAVYRSEHPRHAGRVWIDSVAPPEFRFDEFVTVRNAAVGRDFTRMAGWLAEHDDEYGFGATTRAVEKSLARLADALEAEPRTFTGIDHVFDGTFVAIAGDQDAPTWAMAARILADLRDATGTEAPQSIKDLFAEPGRGDPPPGAPRQFNETMNQAVFCNEDLGRRDFDSAWAAYRKAVKKYPVTGRLHATTPPCAGWTIPPEPVRLRDSGTPLVLSGHRYETLSPYE
ncbi:MAG: alpha/beta fold hydrolase, partial [Streptomycetaceae bacterium]|nr:alpha/beta fold hydrolase [Streptomycetaceae bacterium]